MPYIEARITEKLTDAQKDALKTKLGKAISIMHKSESHLMVGLEDGFTLYFSGKALDKGAFVSIDTFGEPASSDCDKMTGEVCKILKEDLDIPSNNVYVKYGYSNDWGWNGSNF